jgi:hypothetical protein
MAYAIVHHFPGGTNEQYQASIAAVHPNEGRDLPEGQIFHAAGPSEGGWTIMAVHESQESWERFRDEVLMPQMQAGISGGFQTPPQETAVALTNIQQA